MIKRRRPYTVRWETKEHGETLKHVWYTLREPTKQGIWLNVGSLGLNLRTIETGSLTIKSPVTGLIELVPDPFTECCEGDAHR